MEKIRQNFTKLLSPIKIGKMELKNRFVFLPHYSGLGTNNGYHERNLMSERNIMHYVERAKGGAAAVTVSSNVDPESVMAPDIPLGSDERNFENMKKLADGCHQYGCKAIAQFNHGGHTTLLTPPQLLFAPSQMPETSSHENTKELEPEDLVYIRDCFVKSALLHKKAGWDAVEIKCGHDGLLRTFISPLFNHRTDEYGGSFENRMRYPLEVYHAIREAVGDDFPVGVRVCVDEFIDNGFSLELGIQIAKAFEDAGADYISTDAGSFTSFYMEIPPAAVPLGFALYMSAELKKVLHIPVIAFGRINDPVQAETVLDEECADLIGMCRQLNCDPETPNKTAAGDIDAIRHCIACNEGCLGTGKIEINCIQNPGSGREKLLGIGTLQEAQEKKKIMVVGGGVAGLKTAEIAAKRGHTVEVYEKTEKLGGQLLLVEKIPYKAEISEVYRYLRYELQKIGVPVITGQEVDVAFVKEKKPDIVVVATGSSALIPSFGGEEEFAGKIISPREALSNFELIGENVLVYDDIGYWQSAGVADYALALGSKVMIVTKDAHVGSEIEGTNLALLMRRLYEGGAEILADHHLKQFTKDGVVVANNYSLSERTLGPFDTAIVASRSVSNNQLYYELKKEMPGCVRFVGDAVAPRRVHQIILEAEELARSL